MATYYKYAERSAEDYVDWGAIGKTMSDTLLKEQENRDKMKADIDKASREFGETLMNSPQGEHRGMNKWALEYANNAQQFQLMQLRNLKAGKLSLKDYLVGRENLKQGTSDAFDIMKKYNDKYGEYMERQKPGGDGSGLEAFLLGEVEGFGNLTSSSLYINPADGQVSAGMRVPRDPNKPYDPQTNPYTAKMSNNPSDYRTLNSLNFALSAQIDKYDAAGAVDGIIDSFATDYQILTRGSRGKLTTVNDVRQMGEDGKLFTDALEKKITANFESNPFNALSTIQDFLVYGPDGEKIELTRDPAEANDHTLLLVANSEQPDGGMPQADFTSESGKKILEYMKDKMGEQVLAGLNRKVTATQGFAPPAPKGPSDNTDKEATDFYRKMRERVFFDRELTDGTTQRTIGRDPLFKFAALFGVPVTENIIEDAQTYDRARRELNFTGTEEEWRNAGGEDKTMPTKVYKVGDLTLERGVDNTELMQAIESQISNADMTAGYRKRGGSNSMGRFNLKKSE